MIPQKFGSAETGDLSLYVNDPAYCIEQKIDGTRALVEIRASGIRFVTHSGKTLSHTAATQHFAAIEAGLAPLREAIGGDTAALIILDGEILTDTGTLWLFDAPQIGEVTPATPFDQRRANLELLFLGGMLAHPRVRLLPSACSVEDKQALVERVEASGAEGVMVKQRSAPYEPGKRVKHSLKVKYVKTADVVVTARDVNGAKNAELAVYGENGVMVPVGGCSMIGKPDAQPGDVVEVRYLYLGSGGRLYQPTLMRLRPDRTPESCRFDQFRMVSKAVIA